MSAPPGVMPTRMEGGNWDTDRSKVKQRDAAIAAAHSALEAAGVPMSPTKVNRLIQKFDRAARRHGRTFHEFLVGEAHLPPYAVQSVLAHPEWARVIAYADPVGERAVNNVMRGRG